MDPLTEAVRRYPEAMPPVSEKGRDFAGMFICSIYVAVIAGFFLAIYAVSGLPGAVTMLSSFIVGLIAGTPTPPRE